MINKPTGMTISKLLNVNPDNSLNMVKNAFPNLGKVPYKWNVVNHSPPVTLTAVPL